MLRILTQVALCGWIATACRSGLDATGHSHTAGASGGHAHGSAPVDTSEAELVPATPDSPAYTQLGPGVEVIEDVGAAARAASSTFTHEGHFAPLLFGTDLRAFTLRLEPGMFLAEHPHAAESMVYTVSGRWVLCSNGNRTVMEPGSVFHFGPDAPTGWEAPFDGEAQVLIVKTLREGEDYAMFCEGMRELASKLDGRYADGEVFYFRQLKDDHPAIRFARSQGAPIDEHLLQAER
jgi:quercetin dioxygenase-like cupin family protein